MKIIVGHIATHPRPTTCSTFHPLRYSAPPAYLFAHNKCKGWRVRAIPHETRSRSELLATLSARDKLTGPAVILAWWPCLPDFSSTTFACRPQAG